MCACGWLATKQLAASVIGQAEAEAVVAAHLPTYLLTISNFDGV